MRKQINVAIVHYHLRTGGVRRVIENAVKGLSGFPVNLLIISGETNPAGLPEMAETAVVPELRYTSEAGVDLSKEIASVLLETACQSFKAKPDIWHFHNHCLGKNPALPLAVRIIAEKGFPVLLQIHDFAEDGRPGLYHRLLACTAGDEKDAMGRALYPSADHVHYALINSRDAGFMVKAGNKKANTHHVPNPVFLGTKPSEGDYKPSNLILYPTRAIRRKNIGEFMLWSALMGEEFRFGLTRGPKNPEQMDIYKNWKVFADYLKLPVNFEMGETENTSYEHLLASAHGIITTSISEGFGLCFLEPFLINKPLCGRLIPEITVDFTSAGLDLSNLYCKLNMPVEYAGKKDVTEHIKDKLADSYSKYQRDLKPETADRVIQSFIKDGRVDFGRLDEPLQKKIITCVKENPEAASLIEPGGLELSGAEPLEKNRRLIRERYSIEKYGKGLYRLYCRVSASKTSSGVGHLSARRLLDCFLAPERFSLLKS